MNEDVARSLLVLSKSVDGVIAQMFTEVGRIEDPALKARFNAAVGDLLGYIARDLIFPLEDIYPTLREQN